MSTYRILTLARRVIQQLLADRRTIALIIVVPLAVLTVAGILLRAESGGVNIGIVLEDQGAKMPLGNSDVNLGQRLTDNLSGINDNIHVQVLSASDAQAAIERGDLDAVITLPADFSAKSVA